MYFLHLLLFFLFSRKASAGTDSNNDPVGLPSNEEMWQEIQRLRSLINQETDLRMAFEQNFLTHLNTIATLEKFINEKCYQINGKHNDNETLERLSNLKKALNATPYTLQELDSRTTDLSSGVQRALARGCLSGYKSSARFPNAPNWPVVFTIRFSRAFEEVPVVTYGIVHLDSVHFKNVRTTNSVGNISKTGFTLTLDKFADTVQYGVAVSWMACPKMK